jgi:hypothetical protein
MADAVRFAPDTDLPNAHPCNRLDCGCGLCAVGCAQGLSSSSSSSSSASASASASADQKIAPKKALKFRSYHPKDEGLREQRMDASVKPNAARDAQWVDREVKAVVAPKPAPMSAAAAAAAAANPLAAAGLTVTARKANWDLKRDVQPKLDLLKAQTDRAVLEMLSTNQRAAARTASAVCLSGSPTDVRCAHAMCVH